MAFLVPNRPTGGVVRDIASLIANWDAMAVDYETDFAAYRVIAEGSIQLNAAAGNTYALLPGGGTAVALTASSTVFYIDPTDYTSAGRTAKFRFRLSILCNGVAPTISYAGILQSVTAVSGTSGNPPLITVFTNANTAGAQPAVGPPTANTLSQAAGTDFTLAGAGFFALSVFTGSAMAANSVVVANAKLEQRWSNP